ncbi:MAG: hypothetical protein AAGI07_09975 [Bacteroidota bacterium]
MSLLLISNAGIHAQNPNQELLQSQLKQGWQEQAQLVNDSAKSLITSKLKAEMHVGLFTKQPYFSQLYLGMGYKFNKLLQVGAGALTHFPIMQDSASNKAQIGVKVYTRFHLHAKVPYLENSWLLNYQPENSSLENIDNAQWSSGMMIGMGYPVNLGKQWHISLSLHRLVYTNATWPDMGKWQVQVGLNKNMFPGKLAKAKNYSKKLKNLGQSNPLETIKKYVAQKVKLAGNVSLLSNDPFRMEIAPLFHVALDSQFSVGAGPSFQFVEKRENQNQSYEMDYGARVYGRYQPKKLLPYLQLEYEGTAAGLDTTRKELASGKWISAALVGIGYELPIGKMGNFQLTVLRDVSWNGATIVRNTPWVIRTGFSSKLPIKENSDIKGPPQVKIPNPMEKLFQLEGSVGMFLGEQSAVNFSPAITHTFKKYVAVGAGPVIQYQKDNQNHQLAYGGRLFTRTKAKRGIPFGQLEYENINTRRFDQRLTSSNQERNWQQTWLTGAGLQMPIGKKAAYQIILLRDLTRQHNTTQKDSPWVIRMGLQI